MKYKIINKDCLEVLPVLSSVDTIFADPPDNINLGYDQHEDSMSHLEYIKFLEELVFSCVERASTTYISFNAKWITDMAIIIDKAIGEFITVQHRWLVQGFSFGQHNHHDLANNFRPIIRLTRTGAYKNPDAVRVESSRMKIGDKRANPKGRVPGDVWFSDFLQYSRVVGNAKQRRSWHPTQLHEGLVEDCLLMSTPEGGTVIDPFAGTGTTLRVCLKNGWNCTTIDMSQNYCEKIAEEHGIPQVADDIWLDNR